MDYSISGCSKVVIEVSSDDSGSEPVKSKPFSKDVAVHKKLYSHGYKTFHLINCNVFQGTSKQVLSDEWDTYKQVSSDESDYELVKSKPSVGKESLEQWREIRSEQDKAYEDKAGKKAEEELIKEVFMIVF